MDTSSIFIQLLKLLIFDAVFAAAIFALLIPLKKIKCATYAVLKRDFIGYFSSPTGYVFICVFMLLSSIAAFWPEEFFNSNLATLDQLNRWFPLIMLVFIPAITMSIWSEEQREGTDELLLTIPASDVDIVLGKYLAAVFIFTVALFFSQLTNFMVLLQLSVGDVDVGLFIATYIGYWFIGIAMLALGMAASFLTNNLTVSFILGALVNAPLVFMLYIGSITSGRGLAQSLSWWSYLARFSDFGRGMISFASTSFFLLVAAVGVYLSIILIGRRHWQGGRDGKSMFGHYLVRGIALIAIALGASKFFSYHDLIRLDATQGKVSSLSPDTKSLLRNLDSSHPILVEAFISRTVPEQYVQTKVDLVSMLRELESLSGADVQVRLYDNLDTFTEEATRAEEQYGITPRQVEQVGQRSYKTEPVFMGAALSCGLERVVIPFFSRGIPVEYELVRSIDTVVNPKRKRIGIVKTGVNMYGGFDMATMQMAQKQPLIEELEKQYEVEEVDLSSPVEKGKFDSLFVVQPSSLNPQAMGNLVAAVRDGQPAAIFEDPFPRLFDATPTGQPNRPAGGMGGMMGRRPPEPKGDIRTLWSVLGMEMISGDAFGGDPSLVDARVVWQNYNPYAVNVITEEWVFVSPDAPGAGDAAFNRDDDAVAGMSEVLFMIPGGIRDLGTRQLNFTPLCTTGDETGEIPFMDLTAAMRDPAMLQAVRMNNYTKKRYVIAARIQGKVGDAFQASDAGSPLLAQVPNEDQAGKTPAAEPAADNKASDGDGDSRDTNIHVVYVSDIDFLSGEFVFLRANPNDDDIPWQFENVPFALNVVGSLVGEDKMLRIRKRKTRHSTLKMVNFKTEDARALANEQKEEFQLKFKESLENAQQESEKAQEKLNQTVQELQKRVQAGEPGVIREYNIARQKEQIEIGRLQVKFVREKERLEKEQEQKLKVIERDLELGIRKVQTGYKLRAAFLPPIPPLLMGLLVWTYRRKKEKEGIVESRMR